MQIQSFKKTSMAVNKGAVALLTIVIIGAASLIMAIGAARLGLGELETGQTEINGAQTLVLADGCAEEALGRLRKNSSYAGDTLSVNDGSCIIAVTGSGSNRTIESTANIGLYTKKIEIQITINSGIISINSWNEVTP
jgi:hypothetical protein